MIPDIAMPAVRRLADRGAPGRQRSDGTLYSRLVNGDRGGYLGYAMCRRYLKLAQGYTAAHPDGIVSYTAHELRHVCASLLIASGASDVQVAHQMGHSKIETTKNIYGHLFAQDRALILDAMNQAVSRLYAYETEAPRRVTGTMQLPDTLRAEASGPTGRRADHLVLLGLNRCDLVGRTGFEPVTSSVSGNSRASVTVGLSRTGSP
jgi:Phage integrase family